MPIWLSQAFKGTIQYELAGQKTGQLLYLVVANTTYIDSKEATQVSFHPNSSAAAGTKAQENRCRRYLEMQAAIYSSWICPYSSNVSTSPAVAAAAFGPGYVLVDAKMASALKDGMGSDGSMQDKGCLYVQSIVLVDVKWTLKAQVGRLVASSGANWQLPWLCPAAML